MQTMYPGMVNSPVTELAAAITATQTTASVLNGAVLPSAPNLAVIGQGELAETILYTSKSGNALSGITRGLQGTARAWTAGIGVARNFTEADYAALVANINELNTTKAGTAVATGSANGLMPAADKAALNAATNAATASTLVKRDSAGRMKAAAPAASDDVARKAEADTAATAAATAQATANAALAAANYAQDIGNLALGKANLPAGTDLNTLIAPGRYDCPDFTNRPPGINNWLYAVVQAHNFAPSDWVVQTVYDFYANRTWERRRSAGVWLPWVEIWNESKLRVSAGRLEFLDGGVWKGVGVGSAIPSNTVQYEDTTVRALQGLGAPTLVGKHAVKTSGIIRIKITVVNTGTITYSASLRVLTPLTVSNTSTRGITYSTLPYSTPIGTTGYTISTGEWDLLSLAQNYSQGSTTREIEFALVGALPIMIDVTVPGSNPTLNIVSVQICYDIV